MKSKTLLIKISTVIVLLFTATLALAESVTKSVDAANFDKIAISGHWLVKINYAKNYAVQVTADKNAFDDLEVKKEKDVLVLWEKPTFWQNNNKIVNVEITMPKISVLKTSGSSDLTLNGFNLDNLMIDNSGSGKIEAGKNTIQNLSIKSSGSAKFDLADNTITNAEVNLSGSGKLNINIVKGNLTGNVYGSGKIMYSGSPKSVSVGTFGSAKVEHE